MSKKSEDWEYVEVKTGSARQTKAQKKYQEEIDDDGGTYVVKHENAYDNLF